MQCCTCVYGVLACHQGTSAWGADRVHIIVLQDDPTVGQRVDVGSRDLVGAVEAHIVPALQDVIKVIYKETLSFTHEIVSHDEDDVRRFSVDRIYVVERQNKENKNNRLGHSLQRLSPSSGNIETKMLRVFLKYKIKTLL